ncbi:hypothetical protein [Neorhizobium galegae]|nr:hypothetical protein [Neorhizobium galegae]
MSLPPDQLPQDVEQLSRMVLVRDARIADLQEESYGGKWVMTV